MKHDLVPTPQRNDPASAFEALRGEVGLLRRALEGLAAERQAAPDYMPTMADQARRLAGIEKLLEGFSRSPALQLTPESLAVSITRAGESVRAEDRETLTRAFGTLRGSIASINGVVEQAWAADRQWKQLYWAGGTGLVIGALATLSVLHLIG